MKRYLTFLLLYLSILAGQPAITQASDASSGQPLNVLLISGLSRDIPAQKAIERGLSQSLIGPESRNRVFREYMDAPYTGAQFDQAFIQYLKTKYSDTRIDVVLGFTERVESLLVQHQTLFSGADRYVVNGTGQARGAADRHMLWSPDYAATLMDGLRLTGAKRLLVVGSDQGPLGAQRMAEFRQQLRTAAPELDVEWLINRPLTEVTRTLSAAGRDTLVYYMLLFTDENGQRRSPGELLRKLSDRSGAPIVSPWETLLGNGILGGRMLSIEQGSELLARHLMREPVELPRDSSRLMRLTYDQQQLDRWNLKPVHPGEEIHFINVTESLYARYFWPINLVLLVLLLLVGFSVALWQALLQVRESRSLIEKERRSLSERVTQRTHELQQSRQHLLTLLRASGDGMLALDRYGKVSMVNPAACRMLDWQENELVGQPYDGRIYARDKTVDGPCKVLLTLQDGLEKRDDKESFCRRLGSVFPVEYVVTPVVVDDRIEGAVLLFRDITQRRMNEADVQRRADTDSLTSLYNRDCFNQMLRQTLDQAAEGRCRPGLLMLDLDHFKPVNDTWGHLAGDRVLVEVAQRMQRLCRDSDYLSRLGGDEFCVLVPDIAETRALESLAERLIAEIARPYVLKDGVEVSVGVSIGIAHRISSDLTAEAIIGRADRALYQAKHEGRSTWCLDQPERSSV